MSRESGRPPDSGQPFPGSLFLPAAGAKGPDVLDLGKDLLEEGSRFRGKVSSTFRTGVQWDRGVPCMQDAPVAAVLNLDGLGRTNFGTGAAAYTGVRLHIKWRAHFPIISSPHKANGASPDQFMTDPHAQSAEHARRIPIAFLGFAETGRGHTLTCRQCSDEIRIRAA